MKVRFKLLDRDYISLNDYKERLDNAAIYGVIWGKKIRNNVFIELEAIILQIVNLVKLQL